MTKSLIILGAGSFGKEIYSRLSGCHGYSTDWLFKGFLDDNLDAFGDRGWHNHNVLDTPKNYIPNKSDVFISSVATPIIRKKLVDEINNKGGEFISIFHKSSVIDESSQIGKGVFVSPFCNISCDTKIGNHCLFNSYSAIGHDVIIEDFCHINSFSLIGGYVHIGEITTVHPSAVIIPSKRVGSNVVVGAGSIVISNVPDNRTVFGNPAKFLSS